MYKFKVIASDKKARVGELVCPHGKVSTPVFLPVGTQASVKSLAPQDLKDLGVEMILSNTYHLFLRPGAKNIKKLGGLHKFMNWDGPILTDSGGFQVFSLGFGIEHDVGKIVSLYGDKLVLGQQESSEMVVRTKLCKIEEEGPTFQSHLDGSTHFFSPEISVKTQEDLGSDFIVALDECTSPLHDYDYTKASMERSHRWEKRSLDCARDCNMFGVIQGGPFKDLRVESAKFVSRNDFFGVGIGGALVSKQKMHEILDWIGPHLDPEKPRHLLGIGAVDDIFEAVERGVDIFDCVAPTRLARTGFLLPDMNVTKASYAFDKREVLPGFTFAYLHHLFRARELLAYRLATIHNLKFMQTLMGDIRQSICEKRFAKLKEKWLK